MKSKYRVVKKGKVYYPQIRFLYFFWSNLLISRVQCCPMEEWAWSAIKNHIEKEEFKVCFECDEKGNKKE